MSQPLAYHTVVHALEGRGGWTPSARFASAVAHAIDGHLPYSRYYAAGRARVREGASEGAVERAVRDWLATDLNPVIQTALLTSLTANVVWGYNAYNASANLAVRTSVAHGSPGATRSLRTAAHDPEPCRAGSYAVLGCLLDEVGRKSMSKRAAPSLTGLSRLLGVESMAAADVAAVLEAEGSGVSLGQVAAALGCHPRSLQRALRSEGLAFESLRQAFRLIRANALMRSDDSLTSIAAEVGFSDSAHMARSFRASCGMPPSLLRRIAKGGATPEPKSPSLGGV